MKSELIIDLHRAFDHLEEAGAALATLIRQEQLPFIYPNSNEAKSDAELREEIIAAITRVSKNDELQTYKEVGLVCASPATVVAVEDYNNAKTSFQEAVKVVREFDEGSKTRMDLLIDRAMKKEGKSEPLQRTLSSARLLGIDLLRCYAQVRVLPQNLSSIRWTWASRHSAIEKVTHAQATAMAEVLEVEAQRSTALSLLGLISADEILVTVKHLPPQLRANLVYTEIDVKSKLHEVMRKLVTISGFVICQDSKLPRKYLWRDAPEPPPEDAPERKKRIDINIVPEPYIQVLKLHRYKKNVSEQR